MAKRSIPNIPRSAMGTDRAPFDVAVKEVLEVLIGARGGRIQPLPASATLDDVIAKVNEIIARLQ